MARYKDWGCDGRSMMDPLTYGEMNMGKQALCVRRMNLWEEGITLDKPKPYFYTPFPSVLGEAPMELIDRDICETDPQTLQLIPYIIVENPAHMTFSYVRGGASGEQRLAAKMSIGLGGHMDVAPVKKGAAEFKSLVQLEAAREIKEEVGIVVDPTKLQFLGLLYEETSDVGKVHLGIVLLYKLTQDELVTQERGHIEDSKWLSFDDLIKPENYERLEIWSRTLVDYRAHSFVSSVLELGEKK